LHLLLSEKNIEQFMEATTKENPFETVDTLTFTGNWTEDLVGDI